MLSNSAYWLHRYKEKLGAKSSQFAINILKSENASSAKTCSEYLEYLKKHSGLWGYDKGEKRATGQVRKYLLVGKVSSKGEDVLRQVDLQETQTEGLGTCNKQEMKTKGNSNFK